MKKFDIINKLKEEKLVAIIRANSVEETIKIADAVKNGGIKFLEITMTIPEAIDIIKDLVARFKDENIIIGAGTVLDPETARLTILAGAKFVVSPHNNVDIIKMCNRYRVPIFPGAVTVKDIVKAHEYGVDVIKLFPGDSFSPDIIKSFAAPIPHGLFMPTGGVSLENIKDWVLAGAFAIGIGGSLTSVTDKGNHDEITKKAKQFVIAVKEAANK